MPDIALLVRNKKRQVLKCLPGPVTYAEKKAFGLAADIAITSYPPESLTLASRW